VDIRNAEKAIEKESDVRIFRESGKLAAAILPDVNDASNSCILEETKKFFGSLLREADGEKGGGH